ncbi:Wadjet anti-phage system protein JetD domain-containing protein [Paucibacter sp. M5-1]|uniref:Wadjet anti-phage system protein JetD domain-containing protein n=1 Tax=Paucibacter sp. M5-1 TaxID=3015998 RepID=UPI0022B8ADAA|nr:Wadjet anti-phage system protein JetD domain-containing protein [Paucibacter sp. M5-1]MCZ7881554.1 DUF2220 family protein [Paucibacter sp. M5-1]
MDEVSIAVLAWLRRGSGTKGRKFLASDIAARAAAGLRTDSVSVSGALRALRADGLVSYTPDTMGMPYTGYLSVVPAVVEMPDTEKAWREALEHGMQDRQLADALAVSHALFDGLEALDMQHVIAGLLRIRDTSASLGSAYSFSVSAQHILSSSKVLSRLPLSTLRLLGIDRLPTTPRYLVVAGPAHPSAALFIENTTSFEEAVKAGMDAELALVAAYGYGLNMLSDSSAGLALLESVRSKGCEVLSRTGSGHSLERLFTLPSVYFWGDLDREGLRIAMALRQHLPQLALSALYQPMRAMARRRETSHPYLGLSGKALQAAWTPTGEDVLDQLALECATRAVDQEAVDVAQNLHLAGKGLLESWSARSGDL